jgi:hypothetical protein
MCAGNGGYGHQSNRNRDEPDGYVDSHPEQACCPEYGASN